MKILLRWGWGCFYFKVLWQKTRNLLINLVDLWAMYTWLMIFLIKIPKKHHVFSRIFTAKCDVKLALPWVTVLWYRKMKIFRSVLLRKFFWLKISKQHYPWESFNNPTLCIPSQTLEFFTKSKIIVNNPKQLNLHLKWPLF